MLSLLFLGTPNSNNQGFFSEIEYSQVLSTSNSQIINKIEKIIIDDTSWESIWSDIYSNHNTIPTLKPVNFTSKMVIVVSMGVHSSGGYSISIQRIIQMQKILLIKILETSPGETCLVPLVITHPILVVEIPILNVYKFQFSREKTIHDC
jgi:hypothetical protein